MCIRDRVGDGGGERSCAGDGRDVEVEEKLGGGRRLALHGGLHQRGAGEGCGLRGRLVVVAGAVDEMQAGAVGGDFDLVVVAGEFIVRRQVGEGVVVGAIVDGMADLDPDVVIVCLLYTSRCV